MSATDDDIMRTRLMIEGEGSDYRRLNNLLRSFMKWCLNDDQTQEESEAAYHQILFILSQCEFAMEKIQLSVDMYEREKQNYQLLSSEIERRRETAENEIVTYKDQLVDAREVRRNRQEYDALAKIINKYPNRRETTKEIESLEHSLLDLSQNKERLSLKVEERRKEFCLLVHSVNELQALLQDDELDVKDGNSSMDMSQ
ncbi:hypothetical protein LOD99_2358 [Oopsacas minuta]|uniref:THO complex subunit 7 n=1 Tax=Oopsacas minuta TaxID=111878 RepID=A0AAV7K3A5_9METZ|nr:hypothetical protein LOD99_2358 [Oopsacas minuta]